MASFSSTERVEPAGFETPRPGAGDPDGARAEEGKGPEAVERLGDDAALLGDYAVLYLAARLDQIKLVLRRGVTGLLLALAGLLVGAAILATAAVLTMAGIAGGLAELFGQRLWLGQIVTGLGVLGLVALGIYLAVRHITRTGHWKTINRYAELHRRQVDKRRAAAEHVGK